MIARNVVLGSIVAVMSAGCASSTGSAPVTGAASVDRTKLPDPAPDKLWTAPEVETWTLGNGMRVFFSVRPPWLLSDVAGCISIQNTGSGLESVKRMYFGGQGIILVQHRVVIRFGLQLTALKLGLLNSGYQEPVTSLNYIGFHGGALQRVCPKHGELFS